LNGPNPKNNYFGWKQNNYGCEKLKSV